VDFGGGGPRADRAQQEQCEHGRGGMNDVHGGSPIRTALGLET
jgi:hypothetical protein